MGAGCFKPKYYKHPINFLKAPIVHEKIVVEEIKFDIETYKKWLKEVNDKIFDNFLKDKSNEELIEKTNTKRSICKNLNSEVPSKITRYDIKQLTTHFFTDFYTIDDLEEFLSSCSTSSASNSPPTLNELEDEDLSKSLTPTVFFGTDKDIENLSDSDVETLLKQNKIHLELSVKSENVRKLTILLRKASRCQFIGDVIDLKNDEGNSAISIAALNFNIQAFYYLLMKCQAEIPLFIYTEEKKIPFLIYLAKNGKVKSKKENNKVDYLLHLVLNKLIEIYPKEYLLNHLTEVDDDTKLTLPHFLLNIYGHTTDIKEEIIECFKICIREGPECANAMCINYYDPRFDYDIAANLISHPYISVDTIAEFMKHLKKSLQDTDKKLLEQLVRVHQNRSRLESISKLIS